MKVVPTGVALVALLSGVQAFAPFKAPAATPVQVRRLSNAVCRRGISIGPWFSGCRRQTEGRSRLDAHQRRVILIRKSGSGLEQS